MARMRTAAWIVDCSDDELVRVCSVANWLLFNGPTLPSGASMMISKACALAVVYVRQGAPRHLARARRGPGTGTRIPLTGWSPSEPCDAGRGTVGLRGGTGRSRIWGKHD